MPASIQLGSFVFGPDTYTYIPQYGFDESQDRSVPTAPGFFRSTVTLRGSFTRNTHYDNMAAYNALKAAIRVHEQTLLIADGATIFNKTVNIDSHNLPVAWNTGIADFEIVCSFIEANLSVSGFTASFGAFAFDPIPSISRDWSFERPSSKQDINEIKIGISLNGHFAEADFNANLAKLDALATAMNVKSGNLIYRKGGSGGIDATAYPDGLSHAEDFPNNKIEYTANFNIFIPKSGLPANIIFEEVQIIDRPAYPRFAAHYIPSKNGRTVLPLGLSEARFDISGTVEADTWANAMARITALTTSLAPAGAMLEQQPSLSYLDGSSRIEFQYSYSYDN